MNRRIAITIFGTLLSFLLPAQTSSPNLQTISIDKNDDFTGFDLLDIADEQLFVMAEHWHNIKSVPRTTMKLLRYLHQNANVRILAIEQGASVAFMINQYLSSGDTTMLRDISRNTMFWGKENYAFFEDLREFNLSIPEEERIIVRSIDIEYKMESAIYVLNQMTEGKTIPAELEPTIGEFQWMYNQTKEHRESYQGLAVMFYYNKENVTELVKRTLFAMRDDPSPYQSFFGTSYEQFSTMMQDMADGLYFDYTNPNTKYKFRDRLIHSKFIDLINENPDTGILCVIGERHALKSSSIGKLKFSELSPLKGRVMNIRVSALFNGSFLSSDIRRIHFSNPNVLKFHRATLIKHVANDPSLKTKKGFDYSLFINEDGMLTRFDNVYEGEY